MQTRFVELPLKSLYDSYPNGGVLIVKVLEVQEKEHPKDGPTTNDPIALPTDVDMSPRRDDEFEIIVDPAPLEPVEEEPEPI